MKIWNDQGCNDIGVVVGTKWRRYLSHLQQFLRTGNCSSKIVYRSIFLQQDQQLPRCSCSLSEICKSVIIFWDEVFMVRNTVKNWPTWYSAVICRKRRAFVMQSHLMVVSIFLKTCVKDHGDSSSRLLERRIWLVCIEALLLAVL